MAEGNDREETDGRNPFRNEIEQYVPDAFTHALFWRSRGLAGLNGRGHGLERITFASATFHNIQKQAGQRVFPSF